MPASSERLSIPDISFAIGEPMAIAHDLSSEIATALLTSRERSPDELLHLKEMLLEIHSTLEGLTVRAQKKPKSPDPESLPLSKAFGSSV